MRSEILTAAINIIKEGLPTYCQWTDLESYYILTTRPPTGTKNHYTITIHHTTLAITHTNAKPTATTLFILEDPNAFTEIKNYFTKQLEP